MKKTFTTLMLLAFATVSMMAQQIAPVYDKMFTNSTLGFSNPTASVKLWENGAPNSNGVDYNDPAVNQRELAPKFDVFVPKSDKPVPAVIVCPGGGYMMESSYHEGYMWRNFFGYQGIATVMLTYRLPHGNHLVPASDVYETVRYLRTHASELNINPDQIGVMGFSAGGHLASTAATHAPEDARLNFQILFYPVITMDAKYTHQGTRESLIGKNPSEEMVKLYSNELQVNEKTPQAFIVLTSDDTAVPPLNSARYYAALCEKGVPAVMHVYPNGGHGFGINDSFPYHAHLLFELVSWLSTIF